MPGWFHGSGCGVWASSLCKALVLGLWPRFLESPSWGRMSSKLQELKTDVNPPKPTYLLF